MSLLLRARALIHGSDQARAAAEERVALTEESDRQKHADGRLRVAYRADPRRDVVLGKAIEGGWPVGRKAADLAGHMGFWGPSGSGKSYLFSLLLRELLRSGVRRLVVADPKEETIALVLRALVDVARGLPEGEADDLLRRVVVLDLFSATTLPRLQILAPEEGLSPELHAYEVANLITSEMDMAAGFRQEALLHRAIECLIRASLPLTVLPTVLLEPTLLMQLGECAEPRELFVTTAKRIAKEPPDRVMGIVARAERLLRLEAVRLALGGSDNCIDFASLLDDRITLINLAPPQGSADVGRFLSGLVWLRFAHAIRRRRNGSARVHVAFDEWPTFLAAGGARLADSFEDLLRLARSRGVYLSVLSQDMASVAKVSSTLPEVVRTNLHLHYVFRANDAGAWDFLLPVTGTKAKAQAAPWQEDRPGYMDRSAERALLREELTKFPDRECYFVDRRTGLPGVRMRTADLKLRATDAEVEALLERASCSDAVMTIPELKEGERAVQARIESLRGGDDQPDAVEAPLLGRRGRRSELG